MDMLDVMTALRFSGLDHDEIRRRFDPAYDQRRLQELRDVLKDLRRDGMIIEEADSVRLSDQGRRELAKRQAEAQAIARGLLDDAAGDDRLTKKAPDRVIDAEALEVLRIKEKHAEALAGSTQVKRGWPDWVARSRSADALRQAVC
jgi:hypothetical protein